MATTPPPVTIILPTYERAKYLREAIDSALAQTYTNFVLSIGDNSGNDETEQVVKTYDDPRIRYTRHAENRGQQGNWLWLIETAETPFVASLHDDDIWESNFLEDLLPQIENDSTVSMVFSDATLIDGDSNPIDPDTSELSARTHRDRLPGGRLDLSLSDTLRLVAVWNAPQPAFCAIIRRDAVQATEFPVEIDPVYDLWLSYQIAMRGERFAFVPGYHTRYRWHSGSSTAAGWYAPEDEIFRRILADNEGLGPITDEIAEYWRTIRWGRAVRMMESSSTRDDSRAEFSAIADGLGGPKKAVATLAARSPFAWDALRLIRKAAGTAKALRG